LNHALSKALLLGSAAALAFGARALALPQGPVIAGSNAGAGGVTVSTAGATLTVDQTASRVVIDWRSFDIAKGETVAFNQASPDWIAFNRVSADPKTGLSPTSTLDGSLTANGGVWLFSTGGVVIGGAAQVDVGSFAAITGPLANNDINQLLFPDSSGLTTVGIGAPAGVGIEQITVQNGARINAASGYVVLQAEALKQGGDITAADGVGFAVAQSGQVQFLTTPTGQQLQSASVTLLVGKDRPSFTHTGTTSALWVGLDTPGGALQSNYHTVVGIGGSISASGVKPDGSDNGVVFLVGGNQGPDYPGYTNSSIGVDTSNAAITAGHGMLVSSDSAILGETSVGGALDVEAYGDITVAAAATAGPSVTLNSQAGALAINADVTAAGFISANDQAISVSSGITVRSDSQGETNGGITFLSAGDIAAASSSLLVAGAVQQAPSDTITLVGGIGVGGGTASFGAISGSAVSIQNLSEAVSGQGGITFNGPVYGRDRVSVFVDDVSSQGGNTGAFNVLANISSAGFIDMENLGKGAMAFGPGVAVTSTGNQVFLSGGGDTTFAAGSQVTGVSILERTLGALTIASGAGLTTTGAPQPLNGAVLPYGAEFRRASGLNLAAGTMDIQGSVTAGGANARDDILIEVWGTGAPAVIGGAPGGAGFDLSNASFSHLTGRNVVIMSGPGETSGPGVDLQVADLTLDSSKISGLWLGAASSRRLSIDGAVSVVGGGPVSLQLGFVRQGLGGDGVGAGGAGAANPDPGTIDGFIPGEINISGSLGATAAPLSGVSMIARNNIFLGAPGFITAAAADPTLDPASASAAHTIDSGHVFVAARSLSFAAQGRIVQQTTSGFPYAGLVFGPPSAAAPLLDIPVGIDGQTVGADGWSANYAAGPTKVDLFGVIASAGANDISGFTVAHQPDLADALLPSTRNYRVNGCVFGGVCASSTDVIQFIAPILIGEFATGASGVLSPDFTVTATPVLDALSGYVAIGADFDSDRLGSTNPVTESGNRELWTSERAPDERKKKTP
jgi:filamentous hemagglutinin family protein